MKNKKQKKVKMEQNAAYKMANMKNMKNQGDSCNNKQENCSNNNNNCNELDYWAASEARDWVNFNEK